MTGRLAWVLLAAVVFIGAAGCGSKPDQAATTSRGGSTADLNASFRKSIDLVGIWLGHAELNRDALRQHLESLGDATARANMEQIADSFETVSIAMEFRTDSTMEIEIEILPEDSPPVRESTTGTWKVLSCDAASITVHCSEDIDGGQVEEQTLRYEIRDSDHISTAAPVGDELQPFQPRFVFERRVDVQVAEQPGSDPTILR